MKRRRLTQRSITGLVHRIVPSRYPPVSVYDAVASAEELTYLHELEALTNDRIRVQLGKLGLVPPEDRLSGPGTTPIMAAFCHPNPEGSRFSDGSYGVYYAALREQTALIESAWHRARFLRLTPGLGPTVVEMRRYVARLCKPMTLVPARERPGVLSPDDYSASRAFGAAVRATGAWGIHYPSVRDADGQCVAVLRPPAIVPPANQAGHYRYIWDGRQISRIVPVDTAYRLVQ